MGRALCNLGFEFHATTTSTTKLAPIIVTYCTYNLHDITSDSVQHPVLTKAAERAITLCTVLDAIPLTSSVSPPPLTTGMSGRLIAAAGRLSATRSATIRAARQYHQLPSGGLLRADGAVRAARRRIWLPGNSFHNAVISRNASFARFLPKLAAKFIRIPAMAGGVMIGGLAWIQYQATRMSP